MINGITVLIQNAYTDKKLAIQYTGDKILKWGQGFLSKFAYTDTWADGSDSIQFNVTGGTLSVPSEEYSGETLHFVPDYFNSVKAAPYDYVTLRLYNAKPGERRRRPAKIADSIQSIPAPLPLLDIGKQFHPVDDIHHKGSGQCGFVRCGGW